MANGSLSGTGRWSPSKLSPRSRSMIGMWIWEDLAMSEEKLRQQLYDSYANRAHIYYLLFRELRSAFGADRAAELMKRAIYERGVQKADKYACFAPGDLDGLKRAFVGSLPDDGALFAPEVVRCDALALDVKFHRCPLKQAWQEAGLAEEEVAGLCRIAAEVDSGMFGAAGFRFHAETYQPGGEGCCFLHVRPGVGTKDTTDFTDNTDKKAR
jgi:hypothetical protein